MNKLKLSVEELAIESFDTTAPPRKREGTVFGEQGTCTCATQCTCPGCPTCYNTCLYTCDDATCPACPTCADTCANTCDDFSCAESCGGTCWNPRCNDSNICP
jgi:hypothetical protein